MWDVSRVCGAHHALFACRVTGRIPGAGLGGAEGSASTALLSRDDASVGPSEDEEATLLPGGSQNRRTTNGSLDSIFERMESQPVGVQYGCNDCACIRASALENSTKSCSEAWLHAVPSSEASGHRAWLTCCAEVLLHLGMQCGGASCM